MFRKLLGQVAWWCVTLSACAGVAWLVFVLKPKLEAEHQNAGTAEDNPKAVIWVEPAEKPINRSGDTKRPSNSAEYPVIRLLKPETAERIGIATVKAQSRRWRAHLTGPGEVNYDANAYAEVRPRVAGIVRKVHVDEGEVHKAGDLLAVIDSADVATAKAAYLAVVPVVDLAKTTLERTLALRQSDSVPQKVELQDQANLNRAKADLLNAEQKLKNLGFSATEIEALRATLDTSSALRILSPIDGVCVARHAVAGEAVDGAHVLFAIADTRTMWIWIDIEESRIDQVKPGQSVWFELRGLKGEIHEGRVDWIDTAVNTLSRTIRVRAIVENADSHLRAMQFGIARIATSPEETIVVVPRIAVQRRTAGETVFVRLDPTGFQARPVQSFEIDQEHELGIKSGVSPGDEVVTEGAFLLKNELENDAADGDAP